MKEQRIKMGVDKKEKEHKTKGECGWKNQENKQNNGGQKTKEQGKKPQMVGKEEENKK